MFDFTDKVVVITGGTRGIGFATVEAFLAAGAKVIFFGSRQSTVDAALEKLKNFTETQPKLVDVRPRDKRPQVIGLPLDLVDYEAVEEAINKIHSDYGHIDILINNAGISARQKIGDTTTGDFIKILNVNVTAIFNTVKATVPHFKANGGGVILNTSSMVATYGQPSGVGYPASKFAVNGLTKSLARELASSNIRVNAVAPGIINTDMVSGLPEQMIEPLIKSIPLGRIGEARDIANAFLFLASDYASYITGAILPVDGAAQS